MEREAIINMEQVSESGPQQPVVQPMVAPVITTNSFAEISNSMPSVATARPSLIDTCRPSGLSFSQPSQPNFGLGFPQPSSSQHGFGLGFSQPGGSLDSSSMQLGLGMMPPMMSMWAHQLQSQLQTQIETTIQRALAEKLSHTPANSVFEPVRPGGSNHCVVSPHSDQPRRKRTHSGSRSYSPDFESERASSHSEGEDSHYSFKRRKTADSDNCSGKSKQPDDNRVEVNAPVDEELLESSENKKTSNVAGFNDFHKEVPGVKLSESTMEWWLRNRSKLIKKDKFEELVNQYAFDPSIAFLVEPPKAPEPLVAQTKKRDRGRSINSEDKILSSIQRNLLQGVQPLLKLLNETDDTNVRDPLSAGLAMLGAAIHRISKFRQSHYDEFLDNGYESLKDKEPSVRSLYGDDYIQDIQSCTKSKKATETAFSSSSKVKHNSKRNSTHKDHSSNRSFGYDSVHRRSRFRKQRGRGVFSNSRGSYSNSRGSHSHSRESRVES